VSDFLSPSLLFSQAAFTALTLSAPPVSSGHSVQLTKLAADAIASSIDFCCLLSNLPFLTIVCASLRRIGNDYLLSLLFLLCKAEA